MAQTRHSCGCTLLSCVGNYVFHRSDFLPHIWSVAGEPNFGSCGHGREESPPVERVCVAWPLPYHHHPFGPRRQTRGFGQTGASLPWTLPQLPLEWHPLFPLDRITPNPPWHWGTGAGQQLVLHTDPDPPKSFSLGEALPEQQNFPKRGWGGVVVVWYFNIQYLLKPQVPLDN